MRSNYRDALRRTARLELCEVRLAMSAQPVGDFQQEQLISGQDQIGPGVAPFSVNDLTGLNAVRSAYGFSGVGQTVAVIDSGIAYDHPALGGGFGTGHEVVGGWDFAENDANPYDDGPAGSHGTHVAGIIGSTDKTSRGVAAGVDLVALRVFDDSGAGYFNWVDQALQWVHVHRNDYRFPITTVNLSLGTDWNSTSLPGWANLEKDFKTLKDDGIFIAVAAGNGFASHNASGLSYPAASPYVVPVASVDDNGSLSYFSQRQDRVIAAPGRNIRSTVPDYVGNLNGKTDDFATYSGTSMASPYVAGASVLIRQALQFVGRAGVNEDTIYDIMKGTADSIYDPATHQTYSRLNVQKALDSIMPADDYGSTAAAASKLGTISKTSVSGTIGRLDDKDYFTFTAAQTGLTKFSATTTGELKTSWDLVGGEGAVSGANGSVLSFNVVAGQTYTVGLGTSQGLGRYSLGVSIDPAMPSWGAIGLKQVQNVSLAGGEQWFAFSASRAGLLTAEALFAQADGNVSLELYSSSQTLLAANTGAGGAARVDVTAGAGDVFYLHVKGANNHVDFRLTNLVSVSGKTVNIAGTDGADTFTFSAGATNQLTIDGVRYAFAASAANTFIFSGGAGNDSVTLVGAAGADAASFSPGSVQLAGVGYTVKASSAESIVVDGGGGANLATFLDSAGADTFRAAPGEATLDGAGYHNEARGFATIEARSQGGQDVAYLSDSPGNDTFNATPTYAQFIGVGFNNTVRGFKRVEASSTSGADVAYLYDSQGNDTLNASSTLSEIVGAGFDNLARNFRRVEARSSSGQDVANLRDSVGADSLALAGKTATLAGANYQISLQGFQTVNAYSQAGGKDTKQVTKAIDFIFNGIGAWQAAGGAATKAGK